MIDVRQLRYFVAVCEAMHFTRAADMLNVAQSALSAQIKRLEEDLGVLLIQRGKRSAAKLTDAGAIFLVEARQTLAQIERTERVGRLAARGVIGKLDIGHIASAVVDGNLAGILARFRQGHADVAISLFHMETPAQLRALADGTIDVAFIRPRADYPPGVAVEKIDQAPLMVAVPLGDPLAAMDPIPAQALSQKTFIIPQFDEGAAYASQLQRLSDSLAAPLPPPLKVGDFFSALALVAAGYGVSLIPGYFDRVRIDGVVLRSVSGFAEDAILMLARRAHDPSPALTSFLAVARGVKRPRPVTTG